MRLHSKLSLSILSTTLLTHLPSVSFADDNKELIEQMTIFSSNNPLDKAAGSAYQITQKELDNFKYTDIMRTLAVIPGIYIQEEDGYGLRPNIGMRGTGQNRSEKITVMEDAVLASPAPYSSPAAYYFPTPGRIERIEALKGSSTIKYGPRTTGGVLNLLSRQIPNEKLAGKIDSALGGHSFRKLHVHAGGQGERIGGVTEVYRYQANGFRDINHIGGNTGFQKTDALAKVSFNSSQDTLFDQRVEVKLKYSEETSNETYMGLTDVDYESETFSRYSASARDQMNTQHKQIQINHLINLNEDVSVGTVAYYNDFHRNWYKTSKINNKSLSDGGIELASAFDHRAANVTSTLNIDIKANNRNYISQGIQTEINALIANNDLSLGLRYHEDEVDRYQWVDKFTLNTNYQWQLTTAGAPGSDSNRVDSAKAVAFYLQDRIDLDALNIIAGIRYEYVDTNRDDWGKNDQARLNAPTIKSNNFDIFLPAVAATYQITDELLVLGGVQRGFAPASPGNNKGDVEKSWNYEIGGRYNANELSAEAVVFFSDYSNMHGNCTTAQGCDENDIGNQYNAGEVSVHGVEFSLGYDVKISPLVTFPIHLAYTYTNAEFDNTFNSAFASWGNVKKGDDLPYIPENQIYLSAGAKTDYWELTLAGRYTDDVRTTAGSGPIPQNQLIESKIIVDASARYFVDKSQEIYLTVDNLFDEKYMTTRIHGSIFSGKPVNVVIGYTYTF